MHIAIFTIAWLSFGQLSFDLSSVAAALDRTLETLSNRTLQMNWNPLDKTIPLRPLTSYDPGERVYKHVWKNGDRYFEFNFPSGDMRVECFTKKHRFEVSREKGLWKDFKLHPKDQEQKRLRSFIKLAYVGQFFLPYATLTETLQMPAIQAVWLPIGQTHGVLWGNWTQLYERSQGFDPLRSYGEFSAIVCFSKTRQHAFLQWSDSLMVSSSIVGRFVTSSNAQFESETFRCDHLKLTRTQFPNCKTEEEVRNCQSPVVDRSEIRHQFDLDVKDEQLTPAYYGIDEETIQKHVQKAEADAIAKARPRPVPREPRKPLLTATQLDLTIAFGIPVLLLGILLIIIRKT
jgi:hypothetical protein